MATTLTVIWWRDIPAQVIAGSGRQAHKIVLPQRFQIAIDKAAVKAGRKQWDDYLAEWRKVQRPCGADVEAEATQEAERLEAEFTKERLRALVANGGVDEAGAPASPQAPAQAPNA